MSMKITIPDEYRDHFQEVLYLTRWKSPSLLLMNAEEKEKLEEILENSRVCAKDGVVRFFKASIIELDIENGAIDIPEGFSVRLEGDIRAFREEKLGIVVS